MSDDLVKRIEDRGDWLVDAVATATQNRQFLRGEPECDAVACDAIRINGEKAMEVIAKPLLKRIKELEAENARLREYYGARESLDRCILFRESGLVTCQERFAAAWSAMQETGK